MLTTLTKRLEPVLFDWPEWFTRHFDFGEAPTFFGAPMKLEEFREDGTYVIRMEVPGIDPDKDVELTVVDDVLTVRVERREETKADEKEHFRSEFRYGSFVRTVDLPAGADEDDVKATYKDGILEVHVPIDTAKAKAVKVPIARL